MTVRVREGVEVYFLDLEFINLETKKELSLECACLYDPFLYILNRWYLTRHDAFVSHVRKSARLIGRTRVMTRFDARTKIEKR